jgi:NAD-dependent DNA ligase
MGIEEMSAVTLEKLNLNSITALYRLTKQYIMTLDGFGSRKADIIMDQVLNSLNDVMPAKLIEAFGIPGVGEKTAEGIYRLLKGDTPEAKMQHFMNISHDELIVVDGIGARTAANILEILPSINQLYMNLLDYGLKFKVSTLVSQKLLGLQIALTGACPDGRKRPELEKIIAMHGGINGSCSSKTNILVAEDPNGNSGKLKVARKNGTKIVSYQEFFKDL